MAEQPTIQSPESDLARGLAEFRQGRKSLLPEFEIPTDDIPKEEQSGVCPERLTAYNLEQILKELDADTRIKDTGFLQSLTRDLNYYLKHGKTIPSYTLAAYETLSAVRSLGINLLGSNPEELNTKINNPKSLKQLSITIDNDLEQGKTKPGYASWPCRALSAIRSLGINLPGLNPEELITKINNDPSFIEQLTKDLNHDLEQSKTDCDYASRACWTLSAIRSLGINSPGLNPEVFITMINNDTSFIERLTEDLNNRLKPGKTDPNCAPYACQTISAVRNIIDHYSALADEKEKAEATHKLQTAADRTGVPPRPEVKAF